MCEHNCAKISGGKEGLNVFMASELHCCELAQWCLMRSSDPIDISAIGGIKAQINRCKVGLAV